MIFDYSRYCTCVADETGTVDSEVDTDLIGKTVFDTGEREVYFKFHATMHIT